jgi:hypothetical protein
MTAPSARLEHKIRQDFPPSEADQVVYRLSVLPDTSQSAERIQAAMVLRSDGNWERFLYELELVQTDWRDTLMGTGLEHEDYGVRLDQLLGTQQ